VDLGLTGGRTCLLMLFELCRDDRTSSLYRQQFGQPPATMRSGKINGRLTVRALAAALPKRTVRQYPRRSARWRRRRHRRRAAPGMLQGAIEPDSWTWLDIEVPVVGMDRHDEVIQEALEPGQSEWVGPWIAEPDRRIPGELIGAIGHREVDAG